MSEGDWLYRSDLWEQRAKEGAEIIEGNCKIIDALKAERDTLKSELAAYDATLDEAYEQRDKWKQHADSYMADVIMLRAALEEIANHHWSSDHSKWLARRALKENT